MNRQADIARRVQAERPISAAARQAGVSRAAGDSGGREGVERDQHVHELWLVTNLLDLDADLVVLEYRYRWSMDLFFAG